MNPTAMLQDDESVGDVNTYILPIVKCLFYYFCALYDYFGLVKMDNPVARINLVASLIDSTKLSDQSPLILRHSLAWNMCSTTNNNCLKPVSSATAKAPYEIDFQVPRKSYIVPREALNLPPRPRRRRRPFCQWREVYSKLAPILEEKPISDSISTSHNTIYRPSIHAHHHYRQLMKSISELPKPPPPPPPPPPSHNSHIRPLNKKPSVASKLGKKVNLSKFKTVMSTMFHKNKP